VTATASYRKTDRTDVLEVVIGYSVIGRVRLEADGTATAATRSIGGQWSDKTPHTDRVVAFRAVVAAADRDHREWRRDSERDHREAMRGRAW
jgi:hypothetical protein